MLFKILSLLISVTLFLHSKGVPAGTQIVNIAYLEYEMSNTKYHTQSNTLIDVVDQLIDMRLSCMESEDVTVSSGQKEVSFRFLLSNLGNGEDSFELNYLRGNDSNFELSNTKIYLDNGNDIFDAKDQLVNNVTLQHDESQVLFLVSDIPSSAKGVSENGIEAISQIETLRTRADNHNYSIVVAMQSGTNIDYCSYKVQSIWLELKKSATQEGDIIHYTIEVLVHGQGLLNNVVIRDPIPKGTEYIQNSLTLNNVKKGEYKNKEVIINLGNIKKTSNVKPINTIRFDVKVK